MGSVSGNLVELNTSIEFQCTDLVGAGFGLDSTFVAMSS